MLQILNERYFYVASAYFYVILKSMTKMPKKTQINIFQVIRFIFARQQNGQNI